MMPETTTRSTQDVFDDHLRLRKAGDLEGDLARNYAEDVVVLTENGVFHGHDGVRKTAASLTEGLPSGTYEYHVTLVEGEYAYLEWTGRTHEDAAVNDGADSFVIRDGRIVMQTIHYTVSR